MVSKTMTDQELALAVGKGNPGALRVCRGLLKDGHRATVERMHALDITGPAVWIAFKDMGDETGATLVRTIEAEDIKQRLAALGY